MFGLTKREQRWKAEQQAAETVLGFVAAIASVAAEARKADAIEKANADALEIERLRSKIAELEKKSDVPNYEVRRG